MLQSLSFSFHPRLLAPLGCLALLLPVSASGDDQEETRKQTEQLVMQLVEDSQKHKVERVLKGDDALHQAELACVLLASDVSSYTEHLGEVQAACLKAGRLEDALLLAAKMRELGNESGLTQIMLAHAHAGRVQEAIAAREELRKHLPRLTTHRRQRAERDMVLTTGLIGEGEVDVSLLKDLLPEDSLEVEAEWIQAGKRKAPQTEAAVLDRIKKTPVSPLAGGRYAIACADQMMGGKDTHAEGVKVVDLAGKICVETPHVTAHRLLIDLARCARGHGLVEAGNKAINLFLKACAAYSAESEWKPGYLAEAAALLHEWNEDELALKALADARESLKRVFVADVARELLATARAAHTLGQKTERDQAALDALRSACMHPHPRVRGDAAVAVCLFYASLNESIPQPVREALRKVHEGAPATP
jgi:hypothetical protein